MSWVSAANPPGPARRGGAVRARPGCRAWARARARERPSDFDNLVSAGAFSRKSATAAAITTTSARAACSSTAASISAAVSTGTTIDAAGTPDGGLVVTSTTSAPRAAAASATAWPCLPDERLEMKRTGSIGSRVPPALTTTRRPARSRPRAAERRDSGPDPDGFAMARTDDAASTMSAGSARRPAPTSPPANRPSPGSTTCTPRRRSVARLSCTAGCSHISVCMAGHTITGRPGGEDRGGEQSVGDPVGVAAQKARRGRGPRAPDRRVGPDRCGGWGRPRPTGSCCTGSDASAENVTSPTNRVASSVRTGATCTPASTSRRHTSTAL